MGLQRRIEAPDPVEARDLGDDVAGPVPVPGAELVFFGIEVFLAFPAWAAASHSSKPQ